MQRERVTRHDVKARIEEFCELAGHEHIHKGMTSRDLTENVEQLQVYRVAAGHPCQERGRAGAVSRERAEQCATSRSRRARTTWPRRSPRWASASPCSARRCWAASRSSRHVMQTYPARGLKGAVGTRLDQITLFDGDAAKARALDEKVVAHLGLPAALDAVGQVYPRSLDFRVVSACADLGQRPRQLRQDAAPHGRPRTGQRRLCQRARSAPPPCRTR